MVVSAVGVLLSRWWGSGRVFLAVVTSLRRMAYPDLAKGRVVHVRLSGVGG